MAASISIILPVAGEADRINRALDNIREAGFGDRTEIIVVDGDPLGRTISAIKAQGVCTAVSAKKGRARQMNYGASLSSGDILLFLHADTLLPPNASALIDAAMRDARFEAGAFDLGFETDRKIFKITEAYVFLRTRLTRAPFGDQALFIRRSYFERLGGYRDIPVMEDVEILKRIKKRGDKIVIIPKKVRTSPRRYEQEGILYCTFRNASLQLLYALGVSPDKLVKWYR